MPYRLLDQVFETKGVWSGLMLGDPVDRGLTEEEGAAILGGALPLEARLKCNVGRRTSILNASDAANQVRYTCAL